jgi:Na+/H+ antiporter NhaC
VVPNFVTHLCHQWRGRRLVWLIVLGVLVCGCGAALSEATSQPAWTTSGPAVESPAERFGLWTLVPPLVAIGLAVLTRQVVAALFVGTLVASYMLVAIAAPGIPFGETDVVFRGLRVTVETYIVGAVQDEGHILIMLFTLCIGAMVGVVAANGGTGAVVGLLSRWANNSRRGQFVGWAAGHAVFFDDYANTMILGPTLRPLFDRLRISRAKLAYIVDSTAAPVASLVPIGTWIGAEIGFIGDGLDKLAASPEGSPSFLEGINAYTAFLASIGYRFYAVLALALVLIIALTRRDFGPMKRAEREAAGAAAGPDDERAGEPSAVSPWLALAPVLVMVGLTVIILVMTGWSGFPADKTLSWGTLRYLLDAADAYRSILYGALAGLVLAVLMSVIARKLSTKGAMEAGVEGMSRMFPAIVILILAWSLSKATQTLQLGEAVTAALQRAEFSAVYLPMTVFGAACLVSFSTGTSWGTMTILCPVVVEVAARLCAALPEGQAQEALPLFYSAVGAVLAGAIFGDHCSPISDTTVLSSVATSCSLEQHVWTQMPYALVAAVVGVLAGHVLCNVYGQPWWLGLLVGVVALLVIVRIVGRRAPEADSGSAESGS